MHFILVFRFLIVGVSVVCVFLVSVRSVVMSLCHCSNSCCAFSFLQQSCLVLLTFYPCSQRASLHLHFTFVSAVFSVISSFLFSLDLVCSVRWVLLSTSSLSHWCLCYGLGCPSVCPCLHCMCLATLHFYCLSL